MKNQYNKSSAIWEDYPPDLRKAIKEEFEAMAAKENIILNTTKSHYTVISAFIKEQTNFFIDVSWLTDFKQGKKDNDLLKRANFEPILNAFNYNYSPTTKIWAKSASPQGQFDILFPKIASLTSFSPNLMHFIGKYKFFTKPNSNPLYSNVYEHEIEIFKDYKVEIQNPFNGNKYFGIALIRNQVLQIISTDFLDSKVFGVGNIMNFTIDEYRRKAILVPGVSISFDSQHLPIISNTLLSVDLYHNKTTPVVNAYFEKFGNFSRLSCPTPREVAQLIAQYG